MKRIIDFAVSYPRRTLAVLALLTLAFALGIPRLRSEPSTDALMPKHSAEYRMDMRIKKVYGDSKLYLLTLIEGASAPLFSAGSFELIDRVVGEIEEFREFNFAAEELRLRQILDAGGITVIEEMQSADTGDSAASAESESAGDDAGGYFNPLAIEDPLPDDIYQTPLRERRNYSYENYRGVSPETLFALLDQNACRQLETVLWRHGLLDRALRSPAEPFTLKQYRLIVEDFERVYLFKSMEIVKGSMNPISGEDISGTDDSLVPVKFTEKNDEGERILPKTEEDFAAYREKLYANPVFENNVYSTSDGEINALALNVQLKPVLNYGEISRYLIDVINRHNEDGALVFTVNGIPVYERFIQDYMQRDMKVFLPLVFLVVVLTFFFNFRMLRGVLLPTLSVIIAIVWTMGLMGYLGIPVTMVVNALPTILMAVASSYSIHLFNQYLNDRKFILREGLRPGLIASMSRISFTVFLAALTTFIGFMTLMANEVISLQHFGIFSASGTLFSMIITTALIPASLSLMKVPGDRKYANAHKQRPEEPLLLRMIEKTGAICLGHPRTALALAFAVIALCAFGITHLRIENSPLYNFKDDSYIVKADHKVSNALHGSLAINLSIDTGHEGGVKDVTFLKKMDELAQWSVSQENRDNYQFLSAFSFTDIIKRMNKALNGDDQAAYAVPESNADVEDYLMIYSGEDRDSDGRIDSMERFVDPAFRTANIFIKSGTFEGKVYSSHTLERGVKALREHIEADPYFSQFDYAISGQPINFGVLNRLVAKGQFITIALTLLIIAGVILLLFRNGKASIASLVPISCSVIVSYGLMGYLDIPLDIAKSIIASLTIGIGVDDTIHMLKTVRANVLEGKTLREAVQHSYHEAGLAIVYTSIALIFGFSVLMLSQFKALYYLGWLVSINMIVTTVAALFVLPPLMLVLKTDFTKKKNGRTQNGNKELVA